MASGAILITGVAGFIGMQLAQRLLNDGAQIIGIDNLNDYYDVNLKQARLDLLTGKNFTFIKADLIDKQLVADLFAKYRPSVVFHLAAQPGVRHSISHPQDYISTNLIGYFNILEACRAVPPEHLIYASSSSVYGAAAQQPFSPERPADHPVSLYAATKRCNELIGHSYAHLFDVKMTGLRFFTVYGPWYRPDMALSIFAKALYAGTVLKVFNHGKMKRDFTHVGDIVEAMVRLMPLVPEGNPDWASEGRDLSSSTAPWRVLNIGRSQPEDLMSVIKLLEHHTGRQAKLDMQAMPAGDVPVTYADSSALEELTGYVPKVGLEQGIAEFVAWYRDYHKL